MNKSWVEFPTIRSMINVMFKNQLNYSRGLVGIVLYPIYSQSQNVCTLRLNMGEDWLNCIWLVIGGNIMTILGKY